MTTNARTMTADELLAAPGLGRCELVCGELIMMSPAGLEHGVLVNRLGGRLGAYVESKSLGIVPAGEPGFIIARQPDTVRAPDVAFLRADRLGPEVTKGFFEGAPDLAVEVVSPSDRLTEVLAKVQQWLDAGCAAVWVVDPGTRTVSVYRSRREITVLTPTDDLRGDDVVPGFSMPVAELFRR